MVTPRESRFGRCSKGGQTAVDVALHRSGRPRSVGPGEAQAVLRDVVEKRLPAHRDDPRKPGRGEQRGEPVFRGEAVAAGVCRAWSTAFTAASAAAYLAMFAAPPAARSSPASLRPLTGCPRQSRIRTTAKGLSHRADPPIARGRISLTGLSGDTQAPRFPGPAKPDARNEC